jgi:orotidine-5'-phosphate decarboxylase
MRRQHGVILALDETDPVKARSVASAVAAHVDAIKINWPLVLSAGPAMITELAELRPVICDFKLADIPNTNRLITEQAIERGAAGVIVQGFPGMDSVKAVVDAAAGAAVFVVTEMSHPGGQEFTALVADRIARMAVEAKASGVIAPATRPGRISEIRKIVGRLSILAPGVGRKRCGCHPSRSGLRHRGQVYLCLSGPGEGREGDFQRGAFGIEKIMEKGRKGVASQIIKKLCLTRRTFL